MATSGGFCRKSENGQKKTRRQEGNPARQKAAMFEVVFLAI